MTNFEIKSWIYKDIQTKASAYGMAVEFWAGMEKRYYGTSAVDIVSWIVRGTILKETEKAVQVALECQDSNKTWNTWIPKSAMLKNLV